MEEPALFKRLRDADVAVMHDDVEHTYWWLLRSLPAIRYIGHSAFTYPTSWRTLNTGGQFQSYTHQYDFLDYDYKVLGQIEEEQYGGDLVAITNQYYEVETQYPIDHLVSRYTARPETLVVVTDSRRFTPRGGVRPLYQEQNVERIGAYRHLYREFRKYYEQAGFDLPLTDTMNLFIQDNAILYELLTGETLRTSEELLEELPDAPYLPLYDVFGEIFGREEEFGTEPLDEDGVTGLVRWLRRRIELDRKTAGDVATQFNRRVSEDGSVFDISPAARGPLREEHQEIAETLDPNESSIHKRYHGWLQRGEQ